MLENKDEYKTIQQILEYTAMVAKWAPGGKGLKLVKCARKYILIVYNIVQRAYATAVNRKISTYRLQFGIAGN